MKQPDKFGKTEAPLNSCLFAHGEIQTFAQAEKKDDFKIVGYSGEIIPNHWYWGNLAFDLKGITFAKEKTPVLAEHFTSSRIGFATSQKITDKVEFTGKYLSNDEASRLKSDIAAGFPMEASLYIPPAVVEFVADGASVEVNGKRLTGPGAVFRQAVVKEVSMCVFGADSNTSVEAFKNDSEQIKFNLFKETDMSDTKTSEVKFTLETFKGQYPDLHKEIFDAGIAEGEKKERDLFKQLKEACGDDAQLLCECFEQGKTNEQALKAKNEKLTKELAAFTSGKKEPINPEPKKVDPAKAEFSDKQENTEKSDAAKTEDDLTAEFKASKDLQDEFGDVKAYLAFKKRQIAGTIGQNVK